MRQYLSSVQHIVGKQAVIRASRVSDTASVPTSFIEELEALRSKVEELSDEVRHFASFRRKISDIECTLCSEHI